MIKIAFVVCCAAFAAAEAEADAALLYGGYGYGAGLGYAGLGYGYGLAAPVATGYGVSNVANTVGIAGVAPAALPALAGGYAGAGRYIANSAGVVHVAKREANAEAEPGYLYGGYGIHNLGASVGIAGYAPAAVPGVYGGYAGAGRYLANSAGVVHVAKREAEPGYLYGRYGYGLGYAGLGYSGYGLGVYYG